MTRTHTHAAARPRIPIESDAELESLIGSLIPRASRRQFWLLFRERDGHISELLMPMDDHPEEPNDLCHAEDLGMVPFAQLIVNRAGSICDMIGGAAAIFIWEREGDAELSAHDRRWVDAIAGEAARQGVALRAQLLLHSGGVRLVSGAAG